MFDEVGTAIIFDDLETTGDRMTVLMIIYDLLYNSSTRFCFFMSTSESIDSKIVKCCAC